MGFSRARASGASSSKVLPLAAMLAATVSWAIAFPFVTIALEIMSPLPLSSIRFVSAGVLALLWLVWRRPRLPSLPHTGRYLACAFLGSACYSVFINIGQGTVSPGAASFITNIIPILTALVAWPVLGERLNWLGWLGCLLGFAGVSYIAIGLPGGLSFGAGAMFIFLSSVSASIYFILQKPLVALYGPLPCSAYTLVFSALFLLPWFPQALSEVAPANTQQIIAVIGLIFLPTVVAYLGSVYALGHLPAGVTTSLLYLMAPLATGFAYLILGEVPTLATLVGGTLAIIGTIIVAGWGKVAERPARG